MSEQSCSEPSEPFDAAEAEAQLINCAARFPERLLPGKVDILGNSHQIFHALVVAGAWWQYAALRGMVWSRAMAEGP